MTFTDNASAPSSGLKIAWRYQNMPSQENSGHNSEQFDFGLPLSQEEIDRKQLDTNLVRVVKLDEVLSKVASPELSKSTCRVVVKNLTSPSLSINEHHLQTFVARLKSTLRNKSNCAAFLTIDPRTISSCTRHRLHNLADCVMQLKAFGASNTSYPDYDGTLVLHKLAKINSLSNAKKLETSDLGFMTKRNNRHLVFDKLCLPPELGDAPSRTTCSTTNKALDF